jgi:hypothetical protein
MKLNLILGSTNSGRMKFTGALLTISCLLAGCAALKSLRPEKSPKTPPDGVSYFLPKVLIKITGQLTNSFATNSLTQVGVTNWAISNAFTGDGTNGAYTTNGSWTISTNIAVGPEILPTNYYIVSVDALLVPDPSQQFVLKLTHNWFYDDSFNITVNSNGLLTSVNATNADQTGNLIIALGQTAIEAAKFMMKTPSSVPKWSHFEVIFDPTDETEIKKANNKIGTYVSVSCDKPKLGQSETNYVGIEEFDGILYRPKLPYILTLTLNPGVDDTELRYVILSPNQAPILRASVNRSAFVTRTASLQFDNGFLASAYYSKPSEANGFGQILPNIAKGIVSIPTNLIQQKIDITQSKASLAEQQQILLNNQAALIAATTNLLEAQRQLMQYQQHTNNH